MKSKIFTLAIGSFVVFSFASCNKVIIKNNVKSSPTDCFNQLWQTMNDKYTFFDYKKVNWDSIKTVYQPQISDNMTDQQLFDLLAEVIGSVRDGHTSLYAPIDTFRYIFYNNYSSNFDSNFVKTKYLIPNDYTTSETVKSCILNNTIGYLHYPSFGNDLTQKNLDNILSRFSSTKGLIIDIRNNTGGDKSNIYRLLEHFVDGKRDIGTMIEKKDANKNSFTIATPITVEPRGVLYTKPVVILTNRWVYSSANIFAGFMSQLPQVKLIGDITGGGTGVPTSNDLPNGWRYRFSSTIIRLANGNDFEDGLQPTIKLGTDSIAQAQTGKDALIERALLEMQ